MENKDKVKCIKDFYSSLPNKIAFDNGLIITPTQMYLLFKKGIEYEVSHEFKTSEEDKNYFRYVASNLKYNVNNKKNVYERFVTRKNPANLERTFNFYEFFELEVHDDDFNSMSILKLEIRREEIYNSYQNEPNFIKAKELIPILKECETILEEKKKKLVEVELKVNEEDKSHLN